MCIFKTLSLPYLARQSVDAKSLLRWVLPQNLQDSNRSEAWTRVFPRSEALRRSSQWLERVGQQIKNGAMARRRPPLHGGFCYLFVDPFH